LINLARFICQDQKDSEKEIKNIRCDLMLIEYPQEFITSILKPSRNSHHSSETASQSIVIFSYVKGISEKFKHNGNKFNVRTIFKTKQTLHGKLTKTGPITEAKQMKQCVYKIPCECGRCYIGEISRPLEVCIEEHKCNLTQGFLKKSKLAQHACDQRRPRFFNMVWPLACLFPKASKGLTEEY
jgi:hypothetical protein